ncbi:DNA-3-methyladenine glycosylase family protein [Asticcacaulis tiandongensis]|uniref:DNA-3-methyladenine glycosylase family protein n=1 Tax=Asticcacaulis tiandongensis TaxID=2565365 RepID=UPI001126E00D|nr:DNA-3-methyladenine glycosylase [Asticcacaulis tiandongensis]
MTVSDPYIDAVDFLRNLDADWAQAIERVGPCRLDIRAAREPFEALTRAIAYQQLSTRVGDVLIARLKALSPDGPFPTPEDIVATEFDTLRACGFSARKIATIKLIAEGTLSGLVPTRREAQALSDDDLIARLTTIRGIGRWTVEMLLIFTLERPDILPVDDMGVQEGYRRLKGLSDRPKPAQLREIGQVWSPHRTVASWYLWRLPQAVT